MELLGARAGLMIFFNDPIPAPDHGERAIVDGDATIGAIRFEGRRDYGAIGSGANLPFRL
jgi:hypothetical protein